ncbi:hypothetical protein AVEN_192099-1 [Araneus ventricosus]|uniref:Uncharacterized protein n=1 Tax=Araneus ventricosus TaxID=182803 RepID=A0A4Y2B6V2_ARAVE|nr:hypothetical protein AVEN_192099-1 [Araneus ventricosus]
MDDEENPFGNKINVCKAGKIQSWRRLNLSFLIDGRKGTGPLQPPTVELMGPRWPDGKVSALRPKDSKFEPDSTQDPLSSNHGSNLRGPSQISPRVSSKTGRSFIQYPGEPIQP